MNPSLSRRNAADSAAVLRARSTPATVTLPLDGVSIVPRMLRNVVLPLPDGPRTTTNSPGAPDIEADSRTVVRIGPWSYHLRTSARRMIGCASGAGGGIARGLYAGEARHPFSSRPSGWEKPSPGSRGAGSRHRAPALPYGPSPRPA